MDLPIVNNISYSSLVNWQYCPKYYELVNIKRIPSISGKIYIHWGHLIHQYIQDTLLGNISPEDGCKRLRRTWRKFCNLYKNQIKESHPELKNPEGMAIAGGEAVLNIEKEVRKQFGNFKVLEVECRLKNPTDSWPQNFKGFIDLVLELEEGDTKIVILDIKSCKSHWAFSHFKDKYKDYQLTLYKHYYIQSHPEYTVKDIETYFLTIERNPKSKDPINFIRVTGGKEKISNALKWLNSALSAINRGLFVKNRMSCHKYCSIPGDKNTCTFYKTIHCN